MWSNILSTHFCFSLLPSTGTWKDLEKALIHAFQHGCSALGEETNRVRSGKVPNVELPLTPTMLSGCISLGTMMCIPQAGSSPEPHCFEFLLRFHQVGVVG